MKKVEKIRKRIYHSLSSEILLPSPDKLASLAQILSKQLEHEEKTKRYASIKEVLTLLGAGAFLGLSFLIPQSSIIAKPFLDAKRQKDREMWKQYNASYLKRMIRRLQNEKLVTLKEDRGEQQVILTKQGKQRIIKYSLEHLSIEKPSSWDGRWRMIMYDVSDNRKKMRDLFRQTLKTLGFYQIQESVWIYPYPCEEQVSFLREYYGVGNEVLYVIATKMEDDVPYRIFFGIT